MSLLNYSPLFNLASSFLGGVFGYASQDSQNKADKDLALYTHNLNMDAWREQNAYNSPAAAMSRLVDAGINPRSYGQVSNFANASAAPSAQVPQYKDPLGSFSETFNQIGQMLLLSKEIEKRDAEIKSMENQNFARDVQAFSDYLKSAIYAAGYGVSYGNAPKMPSWYVDVDHELTNLFTKQVKYRNAKTTEEAFFVKEGTNLRKLEKQIKEDDYNLLKNTGVSRDSDSVTNAFILFLRLFGIDNVKIRNMMNIP